MDLVEENAIFITSKKDIVIDDIQVIEKETLFSAMREDPGMMRLAAEIREMERTGEWNLH